jgi:membrane-associated HD superfamily phosphohydrolase
MFIPRTLAETDGGPGHGAMTRALVVVGIIATALFFVLSANITLGQENLEVGQIAPRDIREPHRGGEGRRGR